jgi:hypothetical protein
MKIKILSFVLKIVIMTAMILQLIVNSFIRKLALFSNLVGDSVQIELQLVSKENEH